MINLLAKICYKFKISIILYVDKCIKTYLTEQKHRLKNLTNALVHKNPVII